MRERVRLGIWDWRRRVKKRWYWLRIDLAKWIDPRPKWPEVKLNAVHPHRAVIGPHEGSSGRTNPYREQKK